MKRRLNNYQKGFTLIELLVVISIISLLSSIVLASLNTARAKARDVKRISELGQVQKAMALYYDKYGKYPNEGANITGSGPWHTDNFNNMVQQLVTEGFLSAVPVYPPPDGPAGYRYSYYNYGSDPVLGALLVTELEAVPPSSVGYGASCRYTWGSGNTNWCNTNPAIPRTDYCLCNPK